MMPEVRPADAHARRRALAVVVVGVVLGGIAVATFEARRDVLADWLIADPSGSLDRLHGLLAAALVVALGPCVAFASYLWWLGTAVVRAGVFPPDDWLVIRDTPVLRGGAAVVRGRLVQAFGVGLVLAAGAIVILAWRLAAAVGGWME